jgi:hypothetical protein
MPQSGTTPYASWQRWQVVAWACGDTGGTALGPFPTRSARVAVSWVPRQTRCRRDRPVWRSALASRCAMGPMGRTARGPIRFS